MSDDEENWTVDYTILNDDDIAQGSNMLVTLDDDFLNLARRSNCDESKEVDNLGDPMHGTAIPTLQIPFDPVEIPYGHPDAASVVAALRRHAPFSSAVNLDPQEISTEPLCGAEKVTGATAFTLRSRMMWSTPPLPDDLLASKRAAVAAMMKMTDVIFANSMAARVQLHNQTSSRGPMLNTCEQQASPYRHREELATDAQQSETTSNSALSALPSAREEAPLTNASTRPSSLEESPSMKAFFQRAARCQAPCHWEHTQSVAVAELQSVATIASQTIHPLLGEGNWSPRATAVAAVKPNVSRKPPPPHKVFDDNVGAASLAAVELLHQTSGFENFGAAPTAFEKQQSSKVLSDRSQPLQWRRESPSRFHDGGSELQFAFPSSSIAERASTFEENRPRPLPCDIAKLSAAAVGEWESSSPEYLTRSEDSPRQRMRSVTFL